ncbi:MAG: 4Fe-4S dicluster domain-containing protein [Proteobacteria bacterium]|nr:4Fe-4S dicluster domain-containing protein [Pseudomonadota bacterium]
MIKRSFLGLIKPRLQYDMLDGSTTAPEQIPASSVIVLFLPNMKRKNMPPVLKTGDAVKKGQQLFSCQGTNEEFVVSPASGTISSIEPFIGGFGKTYDKISIDVSQDQTVDANVDNLKKAPSLSTLQKVLANIPGNLPVDAMANTDITINTIVVNCAEADLQVTTSQLIVKSKIEDIKEGVKVIKKATNVPNVSLAVPEHLQSAVASIGLNIKKVSLDYPSADPKLLMKDAFGTVVTAGKNCEDHGTLFISAEAVANVGNAYKTGNLPVQKMVTVINKDGSKKMVSALIGTPVKDVLSFLKIKVNENDRIIFGGPMKGTAIFSFDQPVMCDTDGIIIQDKDDIPEISDYPCINCGECVRICPANVPVNLLIRFLEAGQYENAQIMYDLDSCIECGLCSYVCVSKMPVYQYITLAKHELAQIRTAEANNA